MRSVHYGRFPISNNHFLHFLNEDLLMEAKQMVRCIVFAHTLWFMKLCLFSVRICAGFATFSCLTCHAEKEQEEWMGNSNSSNKILHYCTMQKICTMCLKDFLWTSFTAEVALRVLTQPSSIKFAIYSEKLLSGSLWVISENKILKSGLFSLSFCCCWKVWEYSSSRARWLVAERTVHCRRDSIAIQWRGLMWSCSCAGFAAIIVTIRSVNKVTNKSNNFLVLVPKIPY